MHPVQNHTVANRSANLCESGGRDAISIVIQDFFGRLFGVLLELRPADWADPRRPKRTLERVMPKNAPKQCKVAY